MDAEHGQHHPRHRAEAAGVADPAQDGDEHREQDEGGAEIRLGRVGPAQEDDPGDAGHQPGQPVGAHQDAVAVDAGEEGRGGVRPQHVDVEAEAHPVEDDHEGQGQDDEDDDGDGQAQDRPVADESQLGGGDGRAAGEHEGEAGVDGAGAQGGQDGRDPDARDQEAVEEAAEGAHPQGRQNGQGNGHRGGHAQPGQDHGRHDGRQVGRAHDGEVDAPGEHGDHDGEGEDAELRELHGHGLEVAHAEELARQHDAEAHEDQHGDDEQPQGVVVEGKSAGLWRGHVLFHVRDWVVESCCGWLEATPSRPCAWGKDGSSPLARRLRHPPGRRSACPPAGPGWRECPCPPG